MNLNTYKAVSKHVKKVSGLMLTIMLAEMLVPLKSLALTSGPTQPEFQGFTPLATTSLVDPFSGDFSYNIPLVEIDGYPLNLVYRATSNIEEEGSWVGYGWNINVGTLNRMVRGLPDDMNGEEIKSFQNIAEREVNSFGVSFEPSISFNVGVSDGIGLTAGVQSSLGFTRDDDSYTGVAVGVSVGGGVFAGVQAGPFNAGASAGVTLSANTSTGGSITTYSGFNGGASYGDYISIGFGKSVNRTFNTISGWGQPNTVGSLNISSITREIQKNFINSVSNEVPQITVPYMYASSGRAFRLDLGVEIGLLEGVGLDMGIGITASENYARTRYNDKNIHKGYGYMYSENATPTDMVDFTRDNDGGINKDMPFMPPAMKTFDVFSSTAHGATNVFRADRNDFGIVRDPRVDFKNTSLENKTHQLSIKGHSSFSCWIGISVKYDNIKTATEGYVSSGGAADDVVAYRKSNGNDQNLFFRPCGSQSLVDDDYLTQVGKYSFYRQNKTNTVRGASGVKRPVVTEPIGVYTNEDIYKYPPTVIPKALENYVMNKFPVNDPAAKSTIARPTSGTAGSKIGAILNTNKAGQTYMYATPVNNNIKNDVAFRIDGFNTGSFDEQNGLLSGYDPVKDGSPLNERVRDKLYKNTLTPSYATSYLLNGVLSQDYVDVTNDGISDDDLGGFVKFNYSRATTDYRWRVPYDAGQNNALLNRGVKLTKFDDIGSYSIGSKEIWYPHSIESKNQVIEFYLSPRNDAKASKKKIMDDSHPYKIDQYKNDVDTFARMQRLNCIKVYDKHDRYYNTVNAIPVKTIYFDYDYEISVDVPNSEGGKLRLTSVRVQHGNEPIEFAETYNLGYSVSNPAYRIGDKDAWGNYCNNSNNHAIPLCEFPYIKQGNGQRRTDLNADAEAFHLVSIGLPSGGNIDVEYEADDYCYVQNKRAMALTQVEGVGLTNSFVSTDALGLYDMGRNPYLYIYVANPGTADKNYLLNNSDLMYFSFNINIAGNAFSTYDQVKGYAEVEQIGNCPGNSGYIYIKVKPVSLTGTNVRPSPMVNTAINMARAYASDQLYFQEKENTDGRNRNHAARLKKAAIQVADAVFGKNSIAELMKDYKAAHKFNKNKSFVKLAMTGAKVGGGSRVKRLTFDDEWNTITGAQEFSSLVGYTYKYADDNGASYGVASYEPTLGGEENPLRSGTSYTMSNNRSKYPPFDPVELIKEDPIGESFFPTGSVGYSKVIVESIHKDSARSAQHRLVQEFYTSKDFPWTATFGPKSVHSVFDEDYPNPTLRDVLLSFLGVSKTKSSSANTYEIKQDFLVETNDMHGKPKAIYNYRLLPVAGKTELVSSTEYLYHTSGGDKLSNEVEVIQYVTKGLLPNGNINCTVNDEFPRGNIVHQKKTLGVEIDVCTDSREVTSTEERYMAKKGGGLKICLPPQVVPKFNWIENTHRHVDYFRSTTTTKIINRYGIIKSVKTVNEGAETIAENKYYDGITGEGVVQVVKDKYGDDIYTTNIPAYWTKTDMEPSYFGFPFLGTDAAKLISSSLSFNATTSQAFFTTTENVFHAGDELFVKGKRNSDHPKWHRLYVVKVAVDRTSAPVDNDDDPLARSYGSKLAAKADFKVYVIPYRLSGHLTGDLRGGDNLTNIDAVFKYKSGRKNMLNLSAGNYQSMSDPLINSADEGFQAGNPVQDCSVPGFANDVINATANSYGSVNAEQAVTPLLNPVSAGILNQPFVDGTYGLFGNRKSEASSGVVEQRRNGFLKNWYYWLPARYEASEVTLSPMMAHYNSVDFGKIADKSPNAFWVPVTKVTKSVPSVGPVEEKNAVDIYNSIFPDPVTKKIMHVTANGKFGQTWVETFEDMKNIRKYNYVIDFAFSPFRRNMQRSASAVPGYTVFETNQVNLDSTHLKGSFQLNNTHAHTGIHSMYTTQACSVLTTAKVYSNADNYSNVFDFNLDGANSEYTFEVWVKNTSGAVTPPSVVINSGTPINMTEVSVAIDKWVLCRVNVALNHPNNVTFKLPAGQYYDDIRVFPSTANVKAYVYHPFKGLLMAVLDENNYATFYEYNTRNQLVRLKKETEKGIITMTENIKNIKAK